jgi:hypothetical protein
MKRRYFADYRFSEDLDFTLRQALPFEEIRTRLERVYAAVAQLSNIAFALDRRGPARAQPCPRVLSPIHSFPGTVT